MRYKTFDWKSWYAPAYPFFFDTRSFSENRRFPLRRLSFRSCETKSFDKTVMPPSYLWNFSIKEFFWNTKVFANEIIWFSQTKNFRRKIVITPNMNNFFDTPSFLKHWRYAHEIFRYCETWKFWLKIVICPLLSIKFFRYQKFSGKQKVSFTKSFVSVLWNKKFWQNRDALPLCMHENFC